MYNIGHIDDNDDDDDDKHKILDQILCENPIHATGAI